MVDVDEERAQVGDLGFGVGWVSGQGARELEEVEEEGFDELFELEGAVVVFGVFGVGRRRRRQVADALFFEGRELVVKLVWVSLVTTHIFCFDAWLKGPLVPCIGLQRLSTGHL